MGKYNVKKESVKPTELNYMKELAFQLADKELLVSTVMTTFLQDSYYERESEIVDRIKDLVDKVDPLFAAKLAIYARNEGNLRSVTHLVSALLAKYVGGTEWGKRFYSRIVVRPDDMSEIVSAYANLNGMGLNEIQKIPNSIKKGFKEALERLDAYQIDKYKMENREVSLIDLVRLFHPKGNEKNAEAYKRLVNGESLADLYTSKVLEKEMTKAGQATKDATQDEKDEAKREAITEVLNNIKGMPVMNLLRNLRNILLYAPDKVKDACEQLTIEKKILNSRLLPFRFATAYAEIEKMSYDKTLTKPTSSIVFESEETKQKVSESEFNELKQNLLDAIETAIEIACQNIPELEGNCAILVDDSGSMRGDGGGHSRVSAFSKTSTSMIAHLFASMMAWKQHDVYVGLFGDRLIQVPYKRDVKLLDFNKESYEIGRQCGGATEKGIYTFLENVVKEKKKIDNIIVFSDCQIGRGVSFTNWYGTDYEERGEHFHELFKEFRKVNPDANFIVVNLRQSGGTSVFDRSQRILNVSGWSEKIFDIIKTQTVGWDEIIKRIESIEI